MAVMVMSQKILITFCVPTITQYGSTVYYRDCYGLKTIYKNFVHFHFQFEVDFTFNDIKVKNV